MLVIAKFENTKENLKKEKKKERWPGRSDRLTADTQQEGQKLGKRG